MQVRQKATTDKCTAGPGGEGTEHGLLWVVDGGLGCRKAADAISDSMAVECGLLLLLRSEIFPNLHQRSM